MIEYLKLLPELEKDEIAESTILEAISAVDSETTKMEECISDIQKSFSKNLGVLKINVDELYTAETNLYEVIQRFSIGKYKKQRLTVPTIYNTKIGNIQKRLSRLQDYNSELFGVVSDMLKRIKELQPLLVEGSTCLKCGGHKNGN